jgi:hypothetical protein
MILYRDDDVRTVQKHWKKMRLHGVPIEQAAVNDLAIAAVSARYPQQRLAAVTELASRLRNEPSAREMLDRIPLVSSPKKQISPQSVDGSES